MVGDAKDEYVTYTIVITPQTATTPADTAKVKIKKYRGAGVREWLKWSYEFRQLAKKKNWNDEQKGANLGVLIEEDLAAEVAELREEASKKQETFETFFSNHTKKRQDETVHKFAARVKEIVRLFVELPVNAEVIPEVQQVRFLKRGIPSTWQENECFTLKKQRKEEQKQTKEKTTAKNKYPNVYQNSEDEKSSSDEEYKLVGLVANQWKDYSVSVNTERQGSLESVNDDDVEFADESKAIAEGAVQPEELLSEDLTAALAPRYLELLKTNQHLYDGHLGRMQFTDYVLPLSPDYVPVHAKPYAVPRSMESKAKDTIQKLITEEVIEQIYDSEVASPAFFLAKKNGDLRLLIDFRALNKHLRRSSYYVPKVRN
ncbi:Pol Polyprotein [Phytophthora megakarya]|uniref:Pol Polyprotein n=1 Tax=Phytophthora megakarya TaxID=4795 RepID=A0A225UVW2_9STRA|nr:Pol Polyprotein [Phytophthora megakarya]